MKRFLALSAFLLMLATGPALAQSRIQTGSITATSAACTSVNGTSSNGACVAMQIPVNDASATIQLRGAFTGTAQFEVSTDGVNFYAATGNGTTNASSATDVGLWQFQVASLSWIRARASAFASGPIVVRITSSLAPNPAGPVTLISPADVNQGTAGATPWLVTVEDSGGGNATDPTNHAVFVEAVNGNPCSLIAPTFISINNAATGPAVLIAGTALKKTYICSFGIGAAGVVNATIFEGNGSSCGSNKVALLGGTTAAAGISLGNGSSFTLGDGLAPVLATSVAADDICIVSADTTQVSGTVGYVKK